MKDYLNQKGIRFEDERLNSAINLCSSCPKGKKWMDLLTDNLTEKTIEVIDSKFSVKNIPGKNGSSFKVNIDENSDPSFGSTFYNICFKKDEVNYNYSFNLSYFHNKAYYNDNMCILNIEKDFINSGVSVSMNNIIFSISTHKNISGYVGLSTAIYLDKKTKNYVKKIDVENVLEDMRKNLKSRKYYMILDRETIKCLFPEKYEKYVKDVSLLLSEYRNKIYESYDLFYDLNHGLKNEEDEGFYIEYNTLSRNINNLYKKIAEHGFKVLTNFDDVFLPYDEWIKIDNKRPEVVVNVESIPLAQEKINYDFYNPNKLRYEDEEEKENINKNIRR